MPRESDVVTLITGRIESILGQYNLHTAEGRADMDDDLRQMIIDECGNDEMLKRHASEMIREWRKRIFERTDRMVHVQE